MIISDIFTAAAILTATLMRGGAEWYCCIIPIALLLAAALMNIKTAARNRYGIFVLIMLVSAVIALCLGQTDKHRGLYGLETLVCLFAAFYVGGTLDNADKIKKYIFAGAFAAAVIGLTAYAGIIKFDDFVIADRGIRRLQSVFGYANTAAVVFGTGYYMSLDIFDNKNIFGRLASLLTLAAMYLTFSKAAIPIFLVLGGAAVFLKRDYVKRFIIDNAVCIAIATVFLAMYLMNGKTAYAPAETMVKRVVYMQDALTALKENYIIGAGSGAWRYLQYRVQSADYTVLHIHNGWLEYLLENGLVFTVCMLAVTALSMWNAVKNKDWTTAAAIALIAVHSLVDFDFSFGAVLVIYGLMTGGYLKDSGGKRVTAAVNIYIVAVFCLTAVYMGTEYFVRSGFETAYLENKTNVAVERAYLLKKICPYDSELRVSIAALDGEAAEAELTAAERMSPLNPEITRARAAYLIDNNGDDVLKCLVKYIDMAPKQEKTYAYAREYAKTAYDRGLCRTDEYNEFSAYAERKRIENGITDRNKLLEEIIGEREKTR